MKSGWINNQTSQMFEEWDVTNWRNILLKLLKKLNDFIENRLQSKLIVMTPYFANIAKRKFSMIHNYEFNSLIKEICLLYNIPIIDTFEWTHTYNKNNQHLSERNKCVPSDNGAIHFSNQNFGRIIVWQLLQQAFILCENDPQRYCNPQTNRTDVADAASL